jgi:hypothetical protein
MLVRLRSLFDDSPIYLNPRYIVSMTSEPPRVTDEEGPIQYPAATGLWMLKGKEAIIVHGTPDEVYRQIEDACLPLDFPVAPAS